MGLVLLYCVGVWFENTHRLYRRGVMMMVAICDLSIRIGCRSGWFCVGGCVPAYSKASCTAFIKLCRLYLIC